MPRNVERILQSDVPRLMEIHGIKNALQLKNATGLGYATAYRLARGGLPSSSATVAKLCKAFQCEPGDLYRSEG